MFNRTNSFEKRFKKLFLLRNYSICSEQKYKNQRKKCI